MVRLQRVGKKNAPSFRVVITDSRNAAKSGKFLEVVGSYDPSRNFKQLNTERISYWISKGAQTSGTVHNILVSEKIVAGKKVNVLPKKRPLKKEGEEQAAEQPAETPAAEAPAETPAE